MINEIFTTNTYPVINKNWTIKLKYPTTTKEEDIETGKIDNKRYFVRGIVYFSRPPFMEETDIAEKQTLRELFELLLNDPLIKNFHLDTTLRYVSEYDFKCELKYIPDLTNWKKQFSFKE